MNDVTDSYKEVGDMVDKLSSEMMRNNLCPETQGCEMPVSDGKEARLVGLYAKTRYEWVVAAYACYRSNATVVTLYDSLGSDATKYILNLSCLETIVCGGAGEVHTLIDLCQSYPSEIFIKTIICVVLWREWNLDRPSGGVHCEGPRVSPYPVLLLHGYDPRRIPIPFVPSSVPRSFPLVIPRPTTSARSASPLEPPATRRASSWLTRRFSASR